MQRTDYPGYEQSRSAWLGTAPAERWKGFCVAQGWFRPLPDEIRPVVAEMNHRGLEPPDSFGLLGGPSSLRTTPPPTEALRWSALRRHEDHQRTHKHRLPKPRSLVIAIRAL